MSPSFALVAGAAGGLGAALTAALAAQGTTVFAGARQPLTNPAANIIPVALDLEDPASITSAAAAVQARTPRLDLLINCAGFLNPMERLGSLDHSRLMRAFAVNAVGPLLLVEALTELLEKSPRAIVLNISSEAGSLAKQTRGGAYGYRCSKAALNMGSLLLSLDLRERGILVAAIHPGHMRTAMGGPKAPLDPADVAEKILALTDRLTPADSGGFFNADGTIHPS